MDAEARRFVDVLYAEGLRHDLVAAEPSLRTVPSATDKEQLLAVRTRTAA
jgi:hypothetical protein